MMFGLSRFIVTQGKGPSLEFSFEQMVKYFDASQKLFIIEELCIGIENLLSTVYMACTLAIKNVSFYGPL